MTNQYAGIPASSLEFLKSLRLNNNRDWFNARKDQFIEEQTAIENFAGLLLAELSAHDLIETQSGKKSLHRIYRDTRFDVELPGMPGARNDIIIQLALAKRAASMHAGVIDGIERSSHIEQRH